MKRLGYLALFLLSLNSYGDAYMDEQKRLCAENPGKEWNDELNRCQLKEMVDDAEEKFGECLTFTDENQKAKCYTDKAKEIAEIESGFDLSEDTGVSDGSKYLGMGLQTVAGIQMGWTYILNNDPDFDSCNSKSYKLMMAATIANAIGYVYGFTSIKDKGIEITKEYKELVETKKQADAQKLAFDAVSAELKNIGKNEDEWKKINMVVAGLYSAAAIAAGIEIATLSDSEALCGQFDGNHTASSLQKANSGLWGIVPINPAAMFGFTDWLLSYMTDPAGRLVVSTLNGGMAIYLSEEYRKAASRAYARAAKVEEIGDSFLAGTNYECEGNRENINMPHCYCFNSDNKRNPARTNSQICQNTWVGGSEAFGDARKAGQIAKAKRTNSTVCLSRQGAFVQCSVCEQQKWSDGTNNCVQSNSGINLSGAVPSSLLTETGSLYQTALGLANGSVTPAQINGSAVRQAAIKLKKAEKKVIENLKKNFAKKNPKILKALSLDNQRKIAKKMSTTVPQNLKNSLSLTHGTKESFSAVAAKEVKSADAKKALSAAFTAAGLNKKADGKTYDPFAEFSLDGDGSGGGVKYLGEAVNNDYKYENDIHKSPDESIFKIISHRYLVSGLEKLFKE